MKKFVLTIAAAMCLQTQAALASSYSCQEKNPAARPRVIELKVAGNSISLSGVTEVQGVYAQGDNPTVFRNKKGVVRLDEELIYGEMEGSMKVEALAAGFFCRLR